MNEGRYNCFIYTDTAHKYSYLGGPKTLQIVSQPANKSILHYTNA